jgi:hypothetical protein
LTLGIRCRRLLSLLQVRLEWRFLSRCPLLMAMRACRRFPIRCRCLPLPFLLA